MNASSFNLDSKSTVQQNDQIKLNINNGSIIVSKFSISSGVIFLIYVSVYGNKKQFIILIKLCAKLLSIVVMTYLSWFLNIFTVGSTKFLINFLSCF